MSTPTFAALLADEVARGGSRPLVTFYDDATGERVELSVMTYANWVAKTAGLLQDELGLERGARVLVDLPTHWLGPVWLGAAWSIGATVTDRAGTGVELVVCGPSPVPTYAGAGVPVVATALLPMAARFPDPLPDGVLDYGAVVWGQPDAFVAYDPPAPDDPAWSSPEATLTQRELVAGSAAGGAGRGARLLTDLNPCSLEGLRTLTDPLAAGGGTVWVRHADPGRWDAHATAERATVQRRAG